MVLLLLLLLVVVLASSNSYQLLSTLCQFSQPQLSILVAVERIVNRKTRAKNYIHSQSSETEGIVLSDTPGYSPKVFALAILKLWWTSESPGGLVKPQRLGPTP